MKKKLFIFLIAVLIGMGCSSRYRLEMFINSEGGEGKIKVEEHEFIENMVVIDPYAQNKFVEGDRHTVIMTMGMRGIPFLEKPNMIFGLDRYYRIKLYLNTSLSTEQVKQPLGAIDFVQLMEFYEIPADRKIYPAESGYWVIDSLAGKYLFGTIDGVFLNNEKQAINLNGRFKVKIN